MGPCTPASEKNQEIPKNLPRLRELSRPAVQFQGSRLERGRDSRGENRAPFLKYRKNLQSLMGKNLFLRLYLSELQLTWPLTTLGRRKGAGKTIGETTRQDLDEPRGGSRGN